MIPGYFYQAHELSYSFLDNTRACYNLYDPNAYVNLIGDTASIENELENNSDISELLNRCSYKQPVNVKTPLNNELRVMYLNIRSLKSNIDYIRENIEQFKKYDVLCFCETNTNVDSLPNNYNDVALDSFYTPIMQKPHRTSNRGGGVAIYVSERVCGEDDIAKIEVDTSSNSTDSRATPTVPGEHLFVKINIKLRNNRQGKTYIIGNFYRSPSSSKQLFHTYLDNLLCKLEPQCNKHIILGGDFNFNLANIETDEECQKLIDTTTRFNFLQVINKPTRITDHSMTLLDHIYTNTVHDMVSSGVVTFDVSDHLATYITIALHDHRGTLENDYDFSSSYSCINTEGLSSFHSTLDEETWDGVSNASGTQSKYDAFINTYTEHYNNAFPKKRGRRKNERLKPKPWILPWLEDACSRKNGLYHDFVKSPTIANSIKYEKMKKFTEKHIKIAKRKYYASLFDKYRSDSRKQWQIINSALNRHKSKSTKIKLKDSSGNTISDSSEVAERFNKYYSTIADKLKSESTTTNCGNNFASNLKDPVSDTFHLNPTTPSEVVTIINDLKNKATSDSDVRALKIACTIPKFSSVFSEIINSSFETGVFPSQLKLAKVIPIYKSSGAKTDETNYRPISLLSVFSKIFEKAVHNRVYSFLQNNDAFYDMQFGFRKQRSCEHALLTAQNEIMAALSKKQIALLLLIDFSKAFDMVSHDILLHKLEHYGIRGIAHDWFKSYLECRSQYVSIGGKNSVTRRLRYGVPQGSILGPLLFVIYINDMPNISGLAKFILYADDSSIIITANSIPELEAKFAEISNFLITWVSENGLMLNIKKTNYMIFTRQRNLNINAMNLRVAGKPIERKKVAKFLGVLVDEKMTWVHHIKAIKSRMSRYIGVLYRLRHILPLKARLMIFNSLIQSHLNYCSLVWGATNKSKIDTLFSTQKKAIRSIMPGWVNYFYKDGILPTHTKPFFNKHNILTVHNIIVKNMLIFYNNVDNFEHLLPTSVVQTVHPDSLSPTITRDHLSDWCRTYNNIPYNKSVFFKAPLIASTILPNNSDIVNSYPVTFKRTLKTHLLKLQNSGQSEEWCSDNFTLYNLPSTRKSHRIAALERVDYAQI